MASDLQIKHTQSTAKRIKETRLWWWELIHI